MSFAFYSRQRKLKDLLVVSVRKLQRWLLAPPRMTGLIRDGLRCHIPVRGSSEGSRRMQVLRCCKLAIYAGRASVHRYIVSLA